MSWLLLLLAVIIVEDAYQLWNYIVSYKMYRIGLGVRLGSRLGLDVAWRADAPRISARARVRVRVMLRVRVRVLRRLLQTGA